MDSDSIDDLENIDSVLALISGKYRDHALSMLKGRSDAEDIIQEAMLTLYDIYDRFDPYKGSPVAWFFGILRNKKRERIKKENNIILKSKEKYVLENSREFLIYRSFVANLYERERKYLKLRQWFLINEELDAYPDRIDYHKLINFIDLKETGIFYRPKKDQKFCKRLYDWKCSALKKIKKKIDCHNKFVGSVSSEGCEFFFQHKIVEVICIRDINREAIIERELGNG